LIQTAGRAARNINGEVIMYADRITRSMAAAISETQRRRNRQLEWNRVHGLVPRTIVKSRQEILQATAAAGDRDRDGGPGAAGSSRRRDLVPRDLSPRDLADLLEREMLEAASALEFEKAAALRDRLEDLEAQWGLEGPEEKP
jgi:excinuclease ABC subunit B